VGIDLEWTGDDETLSQNTNVYGKVVAAETGGLKKEVVGESKAQMKADKATATAVKQQTSDEQHAATMSAISGTVQGLIQGATGFVGAGAAAGAGGAGGAAGKEAALAGKSASVGAKSQAAAQKAELLKGQQTSALAQGQTAKAARLGRQAERATTRAGNLGARSADLSRRSQAFGYKARFGGKVPKLSDTGTLTGSELASHREQMAIIDSGAVPTGQMSNMGTGFTSSYDDAWFDATKRNPASRTLSFDTFNK
tara:strand:+ start:1085 stop:1846 length:762 start_codon:yes stop_codon:yes gene_type:complete